MSHPACTASQLRSTAITVDAENSVVSDCHRHIQAKESVDQQIAVQWLDRLVFAADREQNLQQQGAQQVFRRNRRTVCMQTAGIELVIQAGKDITDQCVHMTYRALSRHALFQAVITEH